MLVAMCKRLTATRPARLFPTLWGKSMKNLMLLMSFLTLLVSCNSKTSQATTKDSALQKEALALKQNVNETQRAIDRVQNHTINDTKQTVRGQTNTQAAENDAYDKVLIGKWVDGDLSMTISKKGTGYLISWWGDGAANYQGNFQLIDRKLIGQTFNEFRTADEDTIFELSTDSKTITGEGYSFNLHKVYNSKEIEATFKIDRNEKDANGNPVSKISVTVGSEIVYIASITGDAQLFDKSSFDKMGIPRNALAACGAWYAGSGDYFYIVPSQTGTIVYQGYQHEGQRDYSYNWRKLKELAK